MEFYVHCYNLHFGNPHELFCNFIIKKNLYLIEFSKSYWYIQLKTIMYSRKKIIFPDIVNFVLYWLDGFK